MTRWMADNEFKNPKFCEIQQLPKEYRYSYKLYCWPCHTARSEAKSQNLIVILRETKRSLRIYCRTDDGFCNSGQRCPPCRMTRWMAENELKNTQFYEIDQLPKKSRFSNERSLLTPSFCAKRSKVAESNCHSMLSKSYSQNLLENPWWILQLRTMDVLRAEW